MWRQEVFSWILLVQRMCPCALFRFTFMTTCQLQANYYQLEYSCDFYYMQSEYSKYKVMNQRVNIRFMIKKVINLDNHIFTIVANVQRYALQFLSLGIKRGHPTHTTISIKSQYSLQKLNVNNKIKIAVKALVQLFSTFFSSRYIKDQRKFGGTLIP